MAREAKPGITYFQLDTDFIDHKKIKLLFNEFNSDGIWIWLCIISRAYKGEGYYFDISNDDDLMLFANDDCKKDAKLVRQVIDCCLRRRLFDQTLADRYKILTSDRMQEMYRHATYTRRKQGTLIVMYKEYLLIDIPESTKNLAIIPLNNPFVPTQKPTVLSEPVKLEKTEEQTNVQELKRQYNQLEKTKKALIEFVRSHRPPFIEPYLQLWNIWATENGMPTTKAASEQRKSHLRARLKEKDFDFIEILSMAKKSELIINSDKKWFTFDWFTKSQNNYLKVLEGNYIINKDKGKTNEHANEAEEAMERALKRSRAGVE